ncbi:response regulator [Acidobacteriota bacterium]
MSEEHTKRILIADDVEDNIENLKTGLERHGFEVVVAKDGEEALRRTITLKPDCVLLDVMVPNMNGFDVCRRLKEMAKEHNEFLPILLVTAKEDRNSKLYGLEQSLADDYIVRPFEVKEVIAKIRVMLRIKELQEAVREAERLKVLVETTGATAHELNQPLCALMCYLDLLLRKVGEDHPLRKEIVGMAECVDKLAETVRRISEIKRYMTKSYLSNSQIIDFERSSL